MNDKLQTAAQIAQVIVGLVALYVAQQAHQATRRSNDDLFLEMLFPELSALLQLTRRVLRLHQRLFEPFQRPEDKQAVHTQWVRAKEEASRRVTQLKLMFPSETEDLCAAWLKMDEEEDTHTGTNHTSVPSAVAEKALGRMEQLHDAVHASAATIVRKERERRQ